MGAKLSILEKEGGLSMSNLPFIRAYMKEKDAIIQAILERHTPFHELPDVIDITRDKHDNDIFADIESEYKGYPMLNEGMTTFDEETNG